MIGLLLFGCSSTTAPGHLIVPAGTTCEKAKISWTCQVDGHGIGTSVVPFGSGGKTPIPHPVAVCGEDRLNLADEIAVHRECILDGMHYLSNGRWSKSTPEAEAGVLAALNSVRFTALEDACKAKTGQACPKPLLPAADAP